jgi:hypothetical protein
MPPSSPVVQHALASRRSLQGLEPFGLDVAFERLVARSIAVPMTLGPELRREVEKSAMTPPLRGLSLGLCGLTLPTCPLPFLCPGEKSALMLPFKGLS